MGLAKPLAAKKRASARNQFNVTLSDQASRALRARAKSLNEMPATTLACQLLERALTERGRGSKRIQAQLSQLMAEVHALAKGSRNSTRKLLLLAGMSMDEVRAWMKEYFDA